MISLVYKFYFCPEGFMQMNRRVRKERQIINSACISTLTFVRGLLDRNDFALRLLTLLYTTNV